jgi:predicted MarR family transcription regulator
MNEEIDFEDFTKWVADQIFFKEVKDDLFVELACRKLEKLGLVEKTNDEWVYTTTNSAK